MIPGLFYVWFRDTRLCLSLILFLEVLVVTPAVGSFVSRDGLIPCILYVLFDDIDLIP